MFCCNYYFLIGLCIFSNYAIIYQGPLIVDDAYVAAHGNVVTGNFQASASQSALTIAASSPVTISYCNILGSLGAQGILITTTVPITITHCNMQGPSDLIAGNNCNLTVLNTNGYATNPNVLNQTKGYFIVLGHVLNLLVQNCLIEGFSFGIYVNLYNGNFTSEQTIKILNNKILNMDARLSDGNGGYQPSSPINGHGIQLNHIFSVPFIEIGWNEIINQPFKSDVADVINIINSSGIITSTLLIHDNFLQGAYPAVPGTPGYGGGGIAIDGEATDTPTTASAFISMYNNQVVSTANYGIAITAGNNNTISNNRVITCGYLADGTFITASFANGIENYNNHSQPNTVFFNNVALNNGPVGLIRPSPTTGAPQRADYFLPGQTGSINNVSWQPQKTYSPMLSDEANEYQFWLNKLAANNQTVGNLYYPIGIVQE